MSTFDRIAGLPVEIEGYTLERLERAVSSEFTRVSTVVRLHGAGEEGVGEDVTYEDSDQDALQDTGAVAPLQGSWTIASLSRHIAQLDLFPKPPEREVSRTYRVWAFESAMLDLALRQAGRSLHEVLDRPPRPVHFVVSLRLGEPATVEPIHERMRRYPGMRFKLDPTGSWDQRFVDELAATGAVESLDLKGFYGGTVVEVATDPELYRRVAEAFPGAWLEDPDLTPETDAVLAPHRDRLTWDAPIHSVADIDALPYPPRTVNMKPSRFGSLETLFTTYDVCEERGIGTYGGGQSELGPGRGQIQYLASLFHPDAPNDTAPAAFNAPVLEDGLPSSPLEPQPSATGFRWGSD